MPQDLYSPHHCHRLCSRAHSLQFEYLLFILFSQTFYSDRIASFEQILKNKEGQKLRIKHQENVAYMKDALSVAGLPQMDSSSHIIPILVGNPWMCTWISNELLSRFGHYVQAINYPTVAKGQERLRIAPTPFHTRDMMDMFVAHMLEVWKDTGLPLHKNECTTKNCHFCNKPLNIEFDVLPCGARTDCPQLAVKQ
jgi:5-aminolevulinate synthase